MKKPFLVKMFGMSLLLLASMVMAQSGESKFEFSSDGRTVRAINPSSEVIAGRAVDRNLTTIAGNFSTYPYALYFSVWGNTIAQGGSNFPFQIWQAEAFTPAVNATVTEIDVSLGDQSGGSAGIEVGLYDDASGIPGNKIKSVHVSKLPRYGECCGVTTATFKGIPVKAGTQYWVLISTTTKDTDIYAWAFNSTDMRAHLAAYRCTGSQNYCGNNSGKWVAYQYVKNGFQVLGH